MCFGISVTDHCLKLFAPCLTENKVPGASLYCCKEGSQSSNMIGPYYILGVEIRLLSPDHFSRGGEAYTGLKTIDSNLVT